MFWGMKGSQVKSSHTCCHSISDGLMSEGAKKDDFQGVCGISKDQTAFNGFVRCLMFFKAFAKQALFSGLQEPS